MAGRTGYLLRCSRLPLPGVSPCRPQRQRAANRDWNRSRKDEGPCGGIPGGEARQFSAVYPLRLRGARGGRGCRYRQTGPPGAAVILGQCCPPAAVAAAVG